MSSVILDLNPVPDAYGFIYGQARHGDFILSVNVLPPKSHWRGQFKLDGYVPDEHDWIVYVDGEEMARVQTRSSVDEALRSAIENM
ncbi:MAG: hypothetical protein ABI612_13335 [Betaproteobacteria bacterium]